MFTTRKNYNFQDDLTDVVAEVKPLDLADVSAECSSGLTAAICSGHAHEQIYFYQCIIFTADHYLFLLVSLLLLLLLLQVCLDNSDLYNSESAITRTIFGRRNPGRQLNYVSITRNPL